MMRALLAHREARLLLAGQSLSALGDSALWLAMGVWVKTLTGSNAAAALSFGAFTLGMLAGPLGGMLADRVRRRPLLVTADLVTAALVLPLLLVRDRSQVWLVYVVMFGYGLSWSVLSPACNALLKTALPEDLLGPANSALATLREGFLLVSPLLGAGLLAVAGPAPVVLGDALTFVLAAASLLALRVHEVRPRPSGDRLLVELAAGARHLARTPALRRLVSALALAVVAFGLSESVMFAVVAQGLHRSAAFLGVLTVLQGAGSVAAGLSGSPLLGRIGETRLVAFGLGAAACGFPLLAAGALAPVLTGAALLGCCVPWVSIGAVTLLQRRTPNELLGRTNAAFSVLFTLPQTLAIGAGAGLIAVVDYRILLFAMAAVAGLCAVYLAVRPERPAPVEPSAEAPADEGVTAQAWAERAATGEG